MAPDPNPVHRHLRLVGKSVELVPATPAHAAPLFPLVHRRPEVVDMLVWNGPETVAELEAGYATWFRGDPAAPDLVLAVLPAGGGDPMGGIGARLSRRPGWANIGYWLGSDHWGRGYMTEAVRLVTWLCFEHLGTEGVEALCLAHNIGSQRVLEKAGLRRDEGYSSDSGLHDRHHAPEGTELCELRYGLLRADWTRAEGLPVHADVQLELDSSS